MTRHHQLKNEARRAEQRADWARAIELYKSAVRLEDERGSGVDVGVYNRIGDLYLRQGDRKAAVEYYEQAADLYSEHGLPTSAIALCNKILRIAPDRDEVYGRLARLHAATGLMAEARSAFLKFADRVREKDRLSDALETIQDLVSLTGDEELRTAFADQLVEAGLSAQAVAQLRLVYQARVSAGRNAQDIRDRICELDPDADPVRETARPPARATRTPEPPEPPETAEADLVDAFDRVPLEPKPLPEVEDTEPPVDSGDVAPAPPVPAAEVGPEMSDVLERFRSQIEEAVDDADHMVHYDLGVAYMEMGLIDEAAVELGVAARSPGLEASAGALLELCRRSSPPTDESAAEPDAVAGPSLLPIAAPGASAPAGDIEGSVEEEGERAAVLRADPGSRKASADEEDELADMLFQARLAQHRVRAAADEGRTDHGAHLDLGRTYERMGLVTEAVRDLAIAAGGPQATRGEALDALERVAAAEGIAAPALREALLHLLEHGREDVAAKLGRQFLDRAGVPEKDRQIIRDLLPEPESTVPEVREPAAVRPDGSAATAPAVSEGGEAAVRAGSGPVTEETPAGQALASPAEPEDEAIALMGEAEGLRSAGRMDEAEAHYYRALELFEKRRDAVQAIRAVDRLLGLRPDDVVLHHQKNEFAIMLNDRELLVSSYLDLAACLRRQNGLRSARTVYGRILDLDPGNAEARAGIAAVDADELARERRRRQRVEPASGATEVAEATRQRSDVQVIPSDEIDDLFEDIRESEVPSATDEPPDYESHYELGVAFQQMEMWEEAARELTIAVQGMEDSVADAWPGSEEHRVDVILMLGVAQLKSGDRSAARSTLERVLSIDASNAEAAQLLSTLPA